MIIERQLRERITIRLRGGDAIPKEITDRFSYLVYGSSETQIRERIASDTEIITLEDMYKMRNKEWHLWDGQYEKQAYDVWIQGTCNVVLACWPNAGRMCAVDGTGREWGPEDKIAVRASDFQGTFPSLSSETHG